MRDCEYWARTLAREVVVNALRDLVDEESMVHREEALRWFNERSTEPFGYGWALGLSGLNPNVIRAKIRFNTLTGKQGKGNGNGKSVAAVGSGA